MPSVWTIHGWRRLWPATPQCCGKPAIVEKQRRRKRVRELSWPARRFSRLTPEDRPGGLSYLVKQILAPLLVTLAQQPHQVPAGVQAERLRRTRQLHAGFFGR